MSRYLLRRGARGSADPTMVMFAIIASVIITAALSASLIAAHRWSENQSFDASEQTREDISRLAWLGDVGTATRVVPAAVPGTTAQTSVRFESTQREAAWPAACRAATWKLTEGAPEAERPVSVDDEADKLVTVTRTVEFFPSSGSGCDTSAAPVSSSTLKPLKNVEVGAGFTYSNGHGRDLSYPSTGSTSTEVCAAAGKGDSSALQSCAGKSAAERPAERTAWEWADPEPVQVSLEMNTDQSRVGTTYATQSGTRTGVAGRRELTGDPSSPVVDTLRNPPAPDAPAAAPVATVVLGAESVNDVARIQDADPRDVDGRNWQCQETLNGVSTRYITGKFDAAGQRVDIPGSLMGHAYRCRQTAWVGLVTPADRAGDHFAAGESVAGPWSTVVTRRPTHTQPAVSLNDGSGVFTFSWGAVTGATSYEWQQRVNDGAWSATTSTTSLSWASPAQLRDTKMDLRVRAVNAGGASVWKSVSGTRYLLAPVPVLPAGSPATADYRATWPHVQDFNSAKHSYTVEYKLQNSDGWTAAATSANAFHDLKGVKPGATASLRVRVNGTYSSPQSGVVTVTRNIAQLAPSIEAGATGKSSYKVSWTATPGFDAAVNKYRVEYKRTDAATTWLSTDVTTASYTITNVAAGATASVRVTVIGPDVNSPTSVTLTATRPVDAPNTPVITMSGRTDTKVTSTIEALTCEAGATIQYQWHDSIGDKDSAWGTSLTRTHTTSTAGTKVTVKWRARCVSNADASHVAASPWATAAATTTVSDPDKPGVTTKQVDGGLETVVSKVNDSCPAGTTAMYRWRQAKNDAAFTDDSYSDWMTGTLANRTALHKGSGGTKIAVRWYVKCFGTDADSASVRSDGGGVVDYDRPGAPVLANPSNGNAGTNITFTWTSSKGNYFQVVNAAGNHRTYTTSKSLTIPREAGNTCARVRAAVSKAAADANFWSGWSNQECGSTLIPAPPAVSGSSISFVCYMNSWNASWSASSGATSYRYEAYGYAHLGDQEWHEVGSGTTSGTSLSGLGTPQGDSCHSGMRLRVQAINGSGSSAWTTRTEGGP